MLDMQPYTSDYLDTHLFQRHASASLANLALVAKRPLSRTGWCVQTIGGGPTFVWKEDKVVSRSSWQLGATR